MRHHRTGDGERILAVFIDFENLALGFAGKRDRFRIEKVLERLVEKGKLVAKKAYADWSRWSMDARSLHEAAIELIEIPKRSMTGKNSADIRLVVDAVDLAYSKDHIDTFVIVSGDSDFSPLVSKLKELGKHVIGLGLVEATSNLLRDNCDEFIYYEDLDRPAPLPASDLSGLPEGKRKVFGLLLESLLALRRENKETIFSSMAKDTMKRKRPSFNEEYFGYRTFSELLEDAARLGIIEIEKHKNSGTYVVTRFGEEGRLMAGGALPHPQPMATLPPRSQPQPLPPRESINDPRPQARPVVLGPAATTPRPAAPVGPAATTPRPAAPVGPAAMGGRPPVGPTGPAASRTPTAIANAPRTPAPKAPPPPPTRRKPDEEDGPVLGRSLIDDIDDEDFDDEDDVEDFDDDEDDELPSYGPGRKSKPVERPTKPPEQPKGRQGGRGTATAPAKKPAEKKPVATVAPAKKVTGTAKPAAQKPAVQKPAAEPAKKPAAKSPPPPPPVKKAEQPPPPPPVKKAPPKPSADDDGFGAGLDE